MTNNTERSVAEVGEVFLPCRKCGSTQPPLIDQMAHAGNRWTRECLDCCYSTETLDTQELADAAWNHRTEAEARVGEVDGEAIARRFHDTYERLAPSFGYETRPDTKAFDPTSPNGKLMIAVCGEIATALKPTELTEFSSGFSMSEEDTDPKRLGEPTEPSEAKVELAALAAWIAYCVPDDYRREDYHGPDAFMDPEDDPRDEAIEQWNETPDLCTHIGADGFRRCARAALAAAEEQA